MSVTCLNQARPPVTQLRSHLLSHIVDSDVVARQLATACRARNGVSRAANSLLSVAIRIAQLLSIRIASDSQLTTHCTGASASPPVRQQVHLRDHQASEQGVQAVRTVWLRQHRSSGQGQPASQHLASRVLAHCWTKCSQHRLLSASLSVQTIIEPDAVIRGDLATIEIGAHCLLSAHSILRPPPQRSRSTVAYIPQKLDDYVFIGAHTLCEAATIGAYTSVGAHCILGKRSVVSTCCLLRDGCVLVEQTVCPPLSVWEGNPARMVGRLPDAWREMWMEHCRQYFKHFVPLPSSVTSSPRGSVSGKVAVGMSGAAGTTAGGGASGATAIAKAGTSGDGGTG